jgi:hypothetical protein
MHTRWIVALLMALGGMTVSAEAQRSWQSEVGIRGGFTRAVTAGSGGDPTDVISLPGFNLGPVLPLATGLYAIIPWRNKLAFEVDVAASQLSIATTGTVFALGLRGNYAVTRNIYAAAGGGLAYTNGIIRNETQLGVQAAVGYRHAITPRLSGHLELRTTFWHDAENFGPVDAYSVLIGLGGTRGRATAAIRSPRTERAWVSSIGVAGGYAEVKLIGGGSLTTLAFPGYGSALGLVFVPEVTFPPTIFMIVPLRGRIALEPAADIHRFQESGRTSFSGNFSGRINYAIHGGWYGAAGGNLHYLKSTGVPGFARSGANVAAGYRFGLSGALGGRVEMNYTMFAKNVTFGIKPSNTFGLMAGVTVPLK